MGAYPRGQRHERPFKEPRRHPIGRMRRVYEARGFDNFAAGEIRLHTYVDALGTYRPNTSKPLEADVRERVAATWRRNFDAWGYGV